MLSNFISNQCCKLNGANALFTAAVTSDARARLLYGDLWNIHNIYIYIIINFIKANIFYMKYWNEYIL